MVQSCLAGLICVNVWDCVRALTARSRTIALNGLFFCSFEIDFLQNLCMARSNRRARAVRIVGSGNLRNVLISSMHAGPEVRFDRVLAN